ncbi:MAG TPA: hypothetical protein VFN35_34420 [Ktedonobacteraceae bacterium]|nr:hypothetical protein [Ktedonobacteraceae bacterium]
MSYPLGWSLTTRIGVRRERWPGDYDLEAMPLVRLGNYVEPEQPVILLKPQETTGSIPQVPKLSLPTNAEQGLPGAMSRRTQARRQTLAAGLRGTVVALTMRGSVVIESIAAIVAGAIGAGRQVAGPLTMWQTPGTLSGHPYIPAGAILLVPGPLNLAMLRQALHSGIAGVVASSVSSRDLESFLHADLIDLLHRANPELTLPHLPPLTILLTEGLGTVSMPVRTINLLSKYQGTTALLTGMTSVRAHKYPELVISLPLEEVRSGWRTTMPDTRLQMGALVRVCSGRYEGTIGEINYLFEHQQAFPSGIRAHAARVRLEDGSQLVIPLTVLERIG